MQKDKSKVPPNPKASLAFYAEKSMIVRHQVPQPQGNLYIVTDAHLDAYTEQHQAFQQMLTQLAAPQMLICLGDLFKAWLAHPRFWTPLQREVMQAFESLKKKQVEIIFIAGNRELLLPRRYTSRWQKHYPFQQLIHHAFQLEWGTHHYGFIHGDTLNRHDKNYLRWKALAHSLPFESIFRALPTPLAQWLTLKIEAMLAQTNQAYKIKFPEAEIRHFASTVLNDVDIYFVGHFHVDQTLELPGYAGYLRVVPDWLEQRAVLKIDPEGQLETLYFKE